MKGRKRDLETDDLYEALRSHKSNSLGEKLSLAWERQLERQKKTGKKPSLLRATLSVFGWKIAGLGLILAAIEYFIR